MSADDGLEISYGPVSKDLRSWILERNRLRRRLEEVETFINNSKEALDLEGMFIKVHDEGEEVRVLFVVSNPTDYRADYYKCVEIYKSTPLPQLALCYIKVHQMLEGEELSGLEVAAMKQELLTSPEGLTLRAILD